MHVGGTTQWVMSKNVLVGSRKSAFQITQEGSFYARTLNNYQIVQATAQRIRQMKRKEGIHSDSVQLSFRRRLSPHKRSLKFIKNGSKLTNSDPGNTN
jgi:hypothetical protein